jgi:hypothetical protein
MKTASIKILASKKYSFLVSALDITTQEWYSFQLSYIKAVGLELNKIYLVDMVGKTYKGRQEWGITRVHSCLTQKQKKVA